jgi:Cof subfamily protein (haloacid dehalogenase superfamily)
MNELTTTRDKPGLNSRTAREIRLLVLDIDGTIMDQSDRIRGSVAHAVQLAQRRNVSVAIATGRLYQSSLHAYQTIGSTLPLICHEGALIQEPATGFVHRHWPLDSRMAANVLDLTERLNAGDRLSVHFHIQDQLYVSDLDRATMDFCKLAGVEPIVMSDLRQLLNLQITKVMMLSDETTVIARIYDELKKSGSQIQLRYNKSMTELEAFHPTVNKGLAVSYLAEEIMSLKPENVMTIGDDFTDIEMFQYSGISVAMGNAPGQVKAYADWVSSNIEEDGVAQAIERWIW